MNETNTFEPFDAALDMIDQAQIDQVLKEMEWAAHMNTTAAAIDFSNADQMHYTQLSDDTTLEDVLPPSGLASPGSMTTGSTNPSPLIPLLDFELGFNTTTMTADAHPVFPELMANPVNMQDDWLAGGFEAVPVFDFTALCGPTPCLVNSASFTTAPEELLHQVPAWEAPVMGNDTCTTIPNLGVSAPSQPPAPSSVCESGSSTSHEKSHLVCGYCATTFTDKTKLKIHTNKHIKPFRCSATGCDYSTAEKKSLQRHLLAKSKWDGEHRLAAQEYGLREVKYRCSRQGCTYSTIREDNLKRHMTTCL